LSKEISVVVVEYSEYTDPDFKSPSAFSYLNALGQKVYMKVKSRQKAKEYIISQYGCEKYKVVCEKESSNDKIATCRGAVNSASRKGSMTMKIFQNQGRGI